MISASAARTRNISPNQIASRDSSHAIAAWPPAAKTAPTTPSTTSTPPTNAAARVAARRREWAWPSITAPITAGAIARLDGANAAASPSTNARPKATGLAWLKVVRTSGAPAPVTVPETWRNAHSPRATTSTATPTSTASCRRDRGRSSSPGVRSYPMVTMRCRTSASVTLPVTVAVAVSGSTSTCSTPSNRDRPRRTVVAQPSQVMPCTGTCSVVPLPAGRSVPEGPVGLPLWFTGRPLRCVRSAGSSRRRHRTRGWASVR